MIRLDGLDDASAKDDFFRATYRLAARQGSAPSADP
jgi:hypothetical protein